MRTVYLVAEYIEGVSGLTFDHYVSLGEESLEEAWMVLGYHHEVFMISDREIERIEVMPHDATHLGSVGYLFADGMFASLAIQEVCVL